MLQQAAASDTVPPSLPAQGSLQAAFAPWDNVEELVTDTIAGARRQILVQAYLLSSKEIAGALIAAQQRGVDVQVLLDAGQLARASPSMAPELASAGVAVWLETKYQNAHNKIIIIDPHSQDAAVITGSYNLTWTAQHKNAENILIARKNPALAARFVLNWERHRRDAMRYKK